MKQIFKSVGTASSFFFIEMKTKITKNKKKKQKESQLAQLLEINYFPCRFLVGYMNKYIEDNYRDMLICGQINFENLIYELIFYEKQIFAIIVDCLALFVFYLTEGSIKFEIFFALSHFLNQKNVIYHVILYDRSSN